MALSITREQFESIYSGTRVAGYADLFYREPTDDLDLIDNYVPSKLWRLNNLYTIINKYGSEVKFRMNASQHKVYAAALRHPRIIILKSRQQGISTLWLVSFFDDAITMPHYSIGLMAQGQDEAATLLTRTKLLWDKLDPSMKYYLSVESKKDNTKEFSLSNGSNIFIRSSFRSTTLQRLHISEMGKIANAHPQKAQETKTGSLQAIAVGNTVIIESTAEGANLFKDMWDNAIKFFGQLSQKDFYPVFLSWLDDPDCSNEIDQIISEKHAKYFAGIEKETGLMLTSGQKNFWVVQYRELGEKIYQEYPTTPTEAFMATKDGSYYAKFYLENIKGKREKQGLFDKNLDVQVTVDLGMDDTMTLIASQTVWSEGAESVRILDEVLDSGQKISYYTDQLKGKPYYRNITRLVLPHDAEVTDLTSGLTRTETFELELSDLKGLDVIVLPKDSINEGIEKVRQMLRWLWVDPIACEYVVGCLYNYMKEWDDRRERWRDHPNHDQWSHGADVVRYLAMSRVLSKNRNEQARETIRRMRQAHGSGDTDV